MESQLKKGLLDVVILCSLAGGDSYGYRMIQEISPVIEISESTLYPILKRLEASGLLDTYTSEHGGRLRKYYRITDPGRDRIREFIGEMEQMQKVYDYIRGVVR